MNFLGAILVFLSIAVFIRACVGLFSPARAGLSNRLQSVPVWAISVILFGIGWSMLPDNSISTTGAPASEITDTFQTRIERALGASNRNVQRVSVARLQGQRLYVRWTLNDSFTHAWIGRRAQRDILEMLKVVADGSEPYADVFLQGSLPALDRFGNDLGESNVVEAKFTKNTIDRINFNNFRSADVYVIADESSIHPEFLPD